MPYIFQVDFPFEGPFGEEMTLAMKGLAESIANEEGLIWKIWTEDPDNHRAGGVYLFDTKEHAEAYKTMHLARLSTFGISNFHSFIFLINKELSAIDKFTC